MLPLAQRALDKLCRIVEQEMEAINANKLLLPTLTSLELWQKSGRWRPTNPELMTMSDHHQKQYLLSPTHEEAICELLSHKEDTSLSKLPLLLYQISSKFRDEGRPCHGLLRAREFMMKDLYSFDCDEPSAAKTYDVVTTSYLRVLSRLGVPYIRVEGSCGDIGGSFSHEYHFESDAGQDILLRCSNCGHCASQDFLLETRGGIVGQQEAHIECPKCSSSHMDSIKGIEVGHTFLLGDKYSAPLKATFQYKQGVRRPLIMGCYGLGLSRLVQATVTRCSSQNSIVWPWVLAPYKLCIIGPKRGSKESAASVWVESLAVCLQQQVPALRGDVIIDDRDAFTIGNRVYAAKRAGYPLVVVVGKHALRDMPLFELIDNTAAFRSLQETSKTPLFGEGLSSKSGNLLTQLELLNYLGVLCNELDQIRS
ncbi:hypothetical protein HAZT_HAZT006366 [Hyalella azteca]|nr:hypothetical protein HAZT_HAZT006366 [Hyalella azteca]